MNRQFRDELFIIQYGHRPMMNCVAIRGRSERWARD